MKKKALILAFVSIILTATPSKALAPLVYYIGYSALAHIAAFAGLYLYFSQDQAPITDPTTGATLYTVELIDSYKIDSIDPDTGAVSLSGVSSSTVDFDTTYGLMTQSTAQTLTANNPQLHIGCSGGGVFDDPNSSLLTVIDSCKRLSDLVGCYIVPNGSTYNGLTSYDVCSVQDLSNGTNNISSAPSSTFTATDGTNSITW